MSAVADPTSQLAAYLELFAHTEIFIFVFIEIVSKLDIIKRTIFKRQTFKDTVAFVALFGLFSVFGTYIGTTQDLGVITNIRDLAPIVAGLLGGPVVGLSVGLIGGIHRFLLGGVTAVPCALATILAGLIAGLIFKANKGKLIGIIPAILLGLGVETLHGILALVLVQPYSVALDIVLTNIPQMAIAVSLGVGICVIVIHTTRDETPAQLKEHPFSGQAEAEKTDKEKSRLDSWKTVLKNCLKFSS
jgi:sigma-B regulation protein RsbU (phosphoserine phosphatase)